MPKTQKPQHEGRAAVTENENKPLALDDKQLKDVSGGGIFDGITEVKDTRGRTVGEYIYGVLKWWPCPKCSRPTHEDWGYLWCDKCDDKWSSLDTKTWTGSVDELKAAGAAN